jgi:hypothetical protein
MMFRLKGYLQVLGLKFKLFCTAGFAFLFFVIIVMAIVPQAAQAVTAPLAIPFGGFIIGIVIPPPPLVYVCPEYTLITNITPGDPPIMGLYLPPGGALLLYDYKNVYTPLNPLLGYYDPLPTPCGAGYGYPIFPITYIPPFYFAGTGQ